MRLLCSPTSPFFLSISLLTDLDSASACSRSFRTMLKLSCVFSKVNCMRASCCCTPYSSTPTSSFLCLMRRNSSSFSRASSVTRPCCSSSCCLSAARILAYSGLEGSSARSSSSSSSSDDETSSLDSSSLPFFFLTHCFIRCTRILPHSFASLCLARNSVMIWVSMSNSISWRASCTLWMRDSLPSNSSLCSMTRSRWFRMQR
mmetsp:Transcript_4291/g.9410  ORF Transcript_4291/g.9410 Transcript_4291/m.9410 type:complete len:203 (-) Transcript_4291:1862-2470(-)